MYLEKLLFKVTQSVDTSLLRSGYISGDSLLSQDVACVFHRPWPGASTQTPFLEAATRAPNSHIYIITLMIVLLQSYKITRLHY